MNILIICIQGITSKIMARRLTEFASEKGDDFNFKSISYFDADQYYEWADIVLLTPQVKNRLKEIVGIQEEYDFEVYALMDNIMSFNNIPNSYVTIKRLIKHQDKKPNNVWASIGSSLLVFNIIVLLVGLSFNVLSQVLNLLILKELYTKGIGLIALYNVIFIAYQYAKLKDKEPLTYAIIALMTLLALISIDGGLVINGIEDIYVDGYLVSKLLGVRGVVLILPVTFLVVVIFNRIYVTVHQEFLKRHYMSSGYFSLPTILAVILYSIVIFTLILLGFYILSL